MRSPVPPAQRLTALLTVAVLALASLVGALASPATAADVGFSVDDFAGNSMGPMTLVPGNDTCSPSGNNAVTMGTGTMKLDVRVPDAIGCNFGSAQVVWTAPTSVNIEQNGADRITLRYRDVVPNQPSAVTFGLRAVDVNGRVAQVGGLSRTGGPAGDWLTIRYTPEYVGDVAVLSFQSGFDRGHVKSITLLVAAVTNNSNVSVTFEGIGANVGEPSYEMPSIGGSDEYVFPASTTTTWTVPVTGNPAPDVSVTAGKPGWLTFSTSKSGSTTTGTMTGNPGTGYGVWDMTIHADVANSLTVDRVVKIVVPSPVTFTPTAPTQPWVGESATVGLGTVSSTPTAGLTDVGGVPPGMTLQLTGGALRLTGTPTAAGTHHVTATLDSGYRTAPVAVDVVVRAHASVAAAADLTVARGLALTPRDTAVGGYPDPTVTWDGLPAGLTLTRTATGVRLAGTPTATGTSTVTIRATTNGETATGTFQVVVAEPPSLAALAPVTLRADVAQHVDLDRGGDPLPTVTATGLPAGTSVSADSSAIVGTPARSAMGTGTATLTPANVLGTGTSVTLAWTVQAVPQLTGPTTLSSTLGTAASATWTATGYPTPTLTLTAGGATAPNGAAATLPAGLAVSTATGSLTVSGTPTATGTTSVRVWADNGVGTPVSTLVTVRALLAPAFSLDAYAADFPAGVTSSLTPAVTGHEAPTFTVTGTLPAWLSFDPATGAFSGTPPTNAAGTVGPFTVTATNASGTDTAGVTIRVTTPATLTMTQTSLSAVVGQLFSQVVASTTGVPTPTVDAGSLPVGLTATLLPNGDVQIAGTPTTGGGIVTVTLTADNGLGEPATGGLALDVWTLPTVSAPAAADLPVGVPASIPVTVAGYPQATLTAVGLPDGLSLAADGTEIVGTPLTTGTSQVELTATNTAGVSATAYVAVRVTSTPALSPAPATTHVRVGVAVDEPVFGLAGFPTPDVSASDLPDGLSLEVDGTDVSLVGTPTVAGSSDVTLTLDNGTTDPITTTWRIEVEAPATLVAPGSVTADLGVPLTPVTLTVTGHPRPTVTADGLPSGLAIDQSGPAVVITGTPAQSGRFDVTLTAHNGIDADDTAHVVIDVRETPEIDAPGSATFLADEHATLVVTATGHPAPALSVGALPTWLTFDAATGTFSADPAAADAGPAGSVTVTATNEVGTTSTTIALTVTAPPVPAVTSGTTTVRAGTTVDEVLTTVAGHPVATASAVGLPDGLSVEVASDGTLHLVGSTTDAGTHPATLTLTNGIAPAATLAWTVVVQQPAGIEVVDRVDVVAGEHFSVPFTLTGYPGPEMVTFLGLPAGVDVTGLTIQGATTEVGTHDVTISTSNGVGADAVAHLRIVVTAAPVPTVRLGADSVHPGDKLAVSGGGFGANQRVKVWLHSTPQLLATVVTDSDGAFEAEVTVPADTAVGSHTVVVVGPTGDEASASLEVLAVDPTPTPTPDPTTTTTPSPTPVPSPSPTTATDPLATTGGSPAGLLGLALVALAVGATLASLATRRRTR
ncbi:beta strand repeat-containing protein [Cellulomonas composti]|uniref:Uncharacterized protein n=1 Tax=Cellulomonas composti TaxID=266130 RepID=A0A511J8Y2_9CELL|nr:putative Ig domain-containing protein [Cellulomonas composti]GEL94456.1 hypothetical protein CCO02nite_11140 [Cellulomonas composti]